MQRFEAKFDELGGIQPATGATFSPMSEDEAAKLEAQLGAPLPEAYRSFLQTYGGCSFGEYVDFHVVEELRGILPSRGIGHFSHFYGAASADSGKTLGLEWNIACYRERMPETLAPIANDGGDNQICLGVSGDEIGKVYYWDHNNEWDEDDYLDFGKPVPPDMKFQNVHLIANSFDEFVLSLVVSDRA
jgi:hypothetical protein